MDPVVTARVPAGVRQRGLEVLHEIGSTTSELVNAAFAYVIQEKELPKPKIAANADLKPRKLNETQRRELKAFFGDVKVATPSTWASAPFEQLFDDAMMERYADLR